NILQTTEPESSISTDNNNNKTPVIMDIDSLSLDKENSKEVLANEITQVITLN
ncbi:9228_t:CDS:1, partial [Funneliformis mosseae]